MRLETGVRFSLVMPTRNRIGKLRRCLHSFFATARRPERVEAVLLCDFDDATATDFGAIVQQPSWNVKVVFQHRSKKMIRDYNNYGSQCSTGAFVWQLNDDFEMTTRHWDAVLEGRLESFLADKPDRIVYVQVDDSTHTDWGKAEQWGCCCPLLSREAIDAMNCFMPSEIDMWGADVELWRIFQLLPRQRIVNAIAEVKLVHHSHHTELAPPDEAAEHVERVSLKRDLLEPELVRYVKLLASAMGQPDYRPQISVADDPEGPPRLLQEGYRGFNLIGYRGKVVAVSQSLHPFDIEATSPEQLRELERKKLAFTALYTDAVRALVDQAAPASVRPNWRYYAGKCLPAPVLRWLMRLARRGEWGGLQGNGTQESRWQEEGRSAEERASFVMPRPREEPPKLLKKGYRGFNLIAYRGKVFAVSQSLGRFDLNTLSAEELQELQGMKLVFTASGLHAAKALLDEVPFTRPNWRYYAGKCLPGPVLRWLMRLAKREGPGGPERNGTQESGHGERLTARTDV